MKNTNKAELIDVLALKLDTDRGHATAALEILLDAIVRAVTKGDSVTITGLGVFEQRRKSAREAFNPRTGRTVDRKATSVPVFRPGAMFKAVVSGAQSLPAEGTPAQPAVGGDSAERTVTPTSRPQLSDDRDATVERERAELFASVIGRVTSDWSAFGLSARDRQRWQGQGIPADKAHWAAILRDLNQTLPFAVNANSRFGNNPKLTVLEALQEGKPGARICYELAKNRGTEDPTPAPVRSVIHPRSVRVTSRYWDTSTALPKGMAGLLDELAARAKDEIKAFNPFAQLHAQSDTYLKSRRKTVGALLAAAARSYGVYRPGRELDQLAICWANPSSQIAKTVASAHVFADVNQQRHMYFITADCANDIDTGGAMYMPAEHELPSPTGFAWLEGDEYEGDDGGGRPAVILAWSCTEDRISVVRSTATALVDRLGRDTTTRSTEAVVHYSFSDHSAESLSETGGAAVLGPLGRLSRLYRSRDVTRTGSGVTAGAARLSDRPRDPVVVRYRAERRRGSGDGPSRGDRVLNDIRWKVRGHWRNQWYPSARVHRPKWIADYEAGHSAEGTMVSGDTVTKL